MPPPAATPATCTRNNPSGKPQTMRMADTRLGFESHDALYRAIRPVVQPDTTGCPSQYLRLSKPIRPVVRAKISSSFSANLLKRKNPLTYNHISYFRSNSPMPADASADCKHRSNTRQTVEPCIFFDNIVGRIKTIAYICSQENETIKLITN